MVRGIHGSLTADRWKSGRSGLPAVETPFTASPTPDFNTPEPSVAVRPAIKTIFRIVVSRSILPNYRPDGTPGWELNSPPKAAPTARLRSVPARIRTTHSP